VGEGTPLENPQQVADFCFPEGVKIKILHRTQSMSQTHEIMFGSLSKLEESPRQHPKAVFIEAP
jgi:hypothetical protein